MTAQLRILSSFGLAVSLLFVAGAGTTFAITYTTLDDPLGPNGTDATGISGNNIVGYYRDSSIAVHGFIYNGSTYATLDDPLGFSGTYAQGISGSNIVGYYFDSSFSGHGFLYDGSTYTTLNDPLGGPSGTYAQGISGGKIVGTYYDSSGSGAHGFLYDGSTYATLDDPLAATGETNVNGISGNNIVGYYRDSSNAIHGFIYNGSTYTTLDDPLGTGTIATGISGGNIVGYYFDSSFSAHGFLYDGSTYTTLDEYPAGILGIDGKTIVGTYSDDEGEHGFVATVPEPSGMVIAVFCALGLANFCDRRRLPRGIVARQLSLGGTLQVALINGFSASSGQSFDILDWGSLTGTFATLQLPALAGGPQWNSTQLYTAGVLSVGLAGDFNGNGVVDAADYVVWRKGLGTIYTQNDYGVWRTHFGQTAGSGAGTNAVSVHAAVPEPSSLGLLFAFSIIGLIFRVRAF